MSTTDTRRRVRGLALPALALLAAVAVVLAVFTGSDDPVLVDAGKVADAPADDGAATAENAPSAARMQPLLLPTNSTMVVGAVDAPLVMVSFESFGCLWCGHLHSTTMPGVLRDYVDEGLLRIEARMLPYEPAAIPGARIGAAAGLQDRYWALAEHLYPFIAGTGEPPAGRELTAAELGAYRERQTEDALLAEVLRVADDIDLDWDRFFTDYQSQAVEDLVARDTTMARQLGFSGTPAMIINGVAVGGYRSPETMTALLDDILDASTTTG